MFVLQVSQARPAFELVQHSPLVLHLWLPCVRASCPSVPRCLTAFGTLLFRFARLCVSMVPPCCADAAPRSCGLLLGLQPLRPVAVFVLIPEGLRVSASCAVSGSSVQQLPSYVPWLLCLSVPFALLVPLVWAMQLRSLCRSVCCADLCAVRACVCVLCGCPPLLRIACRSLLPAPC